MRVEVSIGINVGSTWNIRCLAIARNAEEKYLLGPTIGFPHPSPYLIHLWMCDPSVTPKVKWKISCEK